VPFNSNVVGSSIVIAAGSAGHVPKSEHAVRPRAAAENAARANALNMLLFITVPFQKKVGEKLPSCV
jgi:hypothetical protein